MLDINRSVTKNKNERIREAMISFIEQKITEYMGEVRKQYHSFDEVIDQIVAKQKKPFSFVRQIAAVLAKY